ncbi:hypothetical protein GF319_08565 [Candidatus Bathyarchaeota archaeon]|nr:hypothetical protein [Candidatus Bathyarchaeota archaeon]
MVSFNYEDYVETLEKFVDLMPRLYDQLNELDTDDLVVMKKYFEYQSKLNQRMSKQVNAVLLKKTSEEFIKNVAPDTPSKSK